MRQNNKINNKTIVEHLICTSGAPIFQHFCPSCPQYPAPEPLPCNYKQCGTKNIGKIWIRNKQKIMENSESCPKVYTCAKQLSNVPWCSKITNPWRNIDWNICIVDICFDQILPWNCRLTCFSAPNVNPRVVGRAGPSLVCPWAPSFLQPPGPSPPAPSFAAHLIANSPFAKGTQARRICHLLPQLIHSRTWGSFPASSRKLKGLFLSCHWS